MGGFEFEHQGTTTYLVYTFEEEEQIDTMNLGMLTNNHITGFADTLYQQVDNIRQVKYNVTAKVSLSQFFAGMVNKKRTLSVFLNIVNALQEAEDYMITPESILFNLEYIFVNVANCETAFICMPVLGQEREIPQLDIFFKQIVFQAQFDQTENCDYVAQILNFLNAGQEFSLEAFKEVLNKQLQGNSGAKTAPEPVIQKPKKAEEKTITPVFHSVEQTGMQGNPVINHQPVFQQDTSQNVQKNLQTRVNDVGVISIPGRRDDSQGMQIPGNKAISQPNVQEKPGNAEKPMSTLYLLQHYSKKNAAIYKEQKVARKAEKRGKKKKESAVQENFVVPGAPSMPPAYTETAAVREEETRIQPVIQMERTQTQSEYPRAESQNPAGYVQQPAAQAGSSSNFGATTVLAAAGAGNTVMLNESEIQQASLPFLIRIKNNEKIPLNKPVFRIGKERSYVDYFVGDNPAVSRSHANIINRDGRYFITDTNSTNHTYVNGIMIQSNVEVELTQGAGIRLGNEEFEFHII